MHTIYLSGGKLYNTSKGEIPMNLQVGDLSAHKSIVWGGEVRVDKVDYAWNHKNPNKPYGWLGDVTDEEEVLMKAHL